jgi:PAS domain S-box-containing protein
VSPIARGVAEAIDGPVEDNLYLRAVLEAQPITLMRIGSDGTVLAVNDAALAILGAERLEQVLGTAFTNLLASDDRDNFVAFIKHVATGHRSSLEVSVNAFTGTHSTMQVHATVHPGAPDGLESVLVTLLDVTEPRRLEQSLVEAMARQADQQAAYDAERQRLKGDLEAASQTQSDTDGHLAEIAELKEKIRISELDRANAIERHDAEVQALNQALAQRQQVNDEQSTRLASFADLETRYAALMERQADGEIAVQALTSDLEKSRVEIEAVRAEADTVRTALDREVERSRTLLDSLREELAAARAELDAASTELESGHAETARQQAAVAALREALDSAMQEQADAAVRSQREAAVNAARFAAAETALTAAQSARDIAIERARQVSRAGRRLARELESEAGAGDAIGMSMGELGAQLEAAVGAGEGPLPITVMVASPDVRTDAPCEVVQQALEALTSDRRSAVAAGQIVIEIAPVDVDESASRSRGHLPAGAYVLVAMHVQGKDAKRGLAPELFDCADATVWADAGSHFFLAFEAMRLARGWIWVAPEGSSDVVFELYVRRVDNAVTGIDIDG